MAVFKFHAVNDKREDYAERGTVVARNEAEAKQKLERLNIKVTSVRRLPGLTGFLKSFTADIR